MHGQRHPHQVVRHTDDGDPREMLRASRQTGVGQCDAGQPSPELAAASNQEVEFSIQAQCSLVIVGLTES